MIESTCPTRIDFAGGTLDLWPLYLFFGNAPTINGAINLYAKVKIFPRRDKAVIIESKDLKIRERFSSLRSLPEKHPLILIIKLLKFYSPVNGLELVTDCQAPAGSGIGGSSALNIALNGGLNRFTEKNLNRATMIEVAKNIETQVIQVPAGTQDYYSAMYGGIQSIHSGFKGIISTKIPLDLKNWSDRFVLCYTGKPHNSGINNWAVYKKAINADAKVNKSLSQIASISTKMESILMNRDDSKFPKLFNAEWLARKALAPGISTSKIEHLIQSAFSCGALAAKVCGAGGGGCVAFFVRKGTKNKVGEILQQQGGQVLPIRFVSRGLQVTG